MVFTISNFQTGFPINFSMSGCWCCKRQLCHKAKPKDKSLFTSWTEGNDNDNYQNVAFIETPVQNMKASSVAIELISIEHCKAETNAIRTVKLRIEEYHNVPMSRDVIESQKVMETHQLWGHFACCFTTHLLATQALFISATFSFQIIYLLDFVMTTLNESATKRNKHTAFRIEKCKWPYYNWFSFWIGFVEKVAWFSGPFTCSGT